MSYRGASWSPRVKIEVATKPSLELMQLAQPIGRAAWAQNMPNRSIPEISRVFNSQDPSRAQRLLHIMQEKPGAFVGAVATLGDRPIGFCLAHDDQSGNALQRIAKRFAGQQPYAWIAHLNVSPRYQHEGVGTKLLNTTLAQFDNDQRPTAYVFEENPRGLAWFKSRGFSPRPDMPSTGHYEYFGEDAEPVQQWRLEAQSVGAVRQQIAMLEPTPVGDEIEQWLHNRNDTDN